jgi:hypothetical protein
MKRCEIKKSLCAAAFLGLLTSGLALAQDAPAATNKPDQPRTASTSTKALSVLGRVSNDGRTLVTDLDTDWAITNGEALKGREGSLVTVKCYVDSEHNQIRVLSVKSAQPELKYASRQGDSAFRR